MLLCDSEQCLQILRIMLSPPTLRQAGGPGPSAFGLSGRCCGKSEDCDNSHGVFKIATWNISGGQSSAQAPSSWTAVDQKIAVVQEIRRWGGRHFCIAGL